jgi:hypothetical protein
VLFTPALASEVLADSGQGASGVTYYGRLASGPSGLSQPLRPCSLPPRSSPASWVPLARTGGSCAPSAPARRPM